MKSTKTIAIMAAMTALSTMSAAQTQYDGYALKTKVDGEDVYLYTRGSEPKMSYTQSEEAEITWLYSADGTTSETLHTTTAKSDEITISNEGMYTLRTADGQETSAWWLSPEPESVSFAVDTVDCFAVGVTATAIAPDITFGSHTLAQTITYQWEAGDSTIATTKYGQTDLDCIYGETKLTVRAINQAFNEAVFTDSVTAMAVLASYSITNRKEDIVNEATATGDAISSPAEVALTNNSKGIYNVCEWKIGDIARLYDQEPVYQFQLPGTFTIALTITNEETGCASTDSSQTITVSDAALEFPNAFTPNGDGVNDVFLPSFRSLKNYELTIYNRWGKRIFTSTDPAEGWDGTENSKKAAAGTYYFVAKAEGYEKGVSFRRKGSVTLLR